MGGSGSVGRIAREDALELLQPMVWGAHIVWMRFYGDEGDY